MCDACVRAAVILISAWPRMNGHTRTGKTSLEPAKTASSPAADLVRVETNCLLELTDQLVSRQVNGRYT